MFGIGEAMLADGQKLLVTGASGWLGQNLVRCLVEGLDVDSRGECASLAQPVSCSVRCLVPPGESASLAAFADRVEVIEGDLRNAEDCRRFCSDGAGGIVLHTAGVIHPRRVADFYAINVAGTQHLLSAAVAGGVRRIVAVSSNSVCGCNPHLDHRFDEDSPARPYQHYGRSKQQMEKALTAYRMEFGLETVIIRCPWFYGPHQPARQALFFCMIRDGRAPIVGDGENRRSLAYVDNLCQGILLAAGNAEADGKIYWIADGEPYSMNEIVDTVERLLVTEFGQSCSGRRVRLPGIVSRVAYGVDSLLQSLGLYHQKIHVLSEMNQTIACSTAGARRELGYAPTVGLEEGMRRSLRWAFAQGQMA
jgi:nucleoside-diphosphate-sugar epimerase